MNSECDYLLLTRKSYDLIVNILKAGAHLLPTRNAMPNSEYKGDMCPPLVHLEI
jgi:hypothetical protein